MKKFTFIIVMLISTKSFGQVSFNDLLIITEVKQRELVNGLLIENNFTYKGRVDKDKDGWTVDTWSYSNGTAWLEYGKILERDKETGKMEEVYMTNFYTTSITIYNSLFNQMKALGWATEGKQFTGENMEGFNSYLYFGEKSSFSQMKGILVGENRNYRGTTAYRFFFL